MVFGMKSILLPVTAETASQAFRPAVFDPVHGSSRVQLEFNKHYATYYVIADEPAAAGGDGEERGEEPVEMISMTSLPVRESVHSH